MVKEQSLKNSDGEDSHGNEFMNSRFKSDADEERLYVRVADEISRGSYDSEAKSQALSSSCGDEHRAKILYLLYRTRQLAAAESLPRTIQEPPARDVTKRLRITKFRDWVKRHPVLTVSLFICACLLYGFIDREEPLVSSRVFEVGDEIVYIKTSDEERLKDALANPETFKEVSNFRFFRYMKEYGPDEVLRIPVVQSAMEDLQFVFENPKDFVEISHFQYECEKWSHKTESFRFFRYSRDNRLHYIKLALVDVNSKLLQQLLDARWAEEISEFVYNSEEQNEGQIRGSP